MGSPIDSLPVTLQLLDRDEAVAVGVDLVELVGKLRQVRSHLLPAQPSARVDVGVLKLGVDTGAGFDVRSRRFRRGLLQHLRLFLGHTLPHHVGAFDKDEKNEHAQRCPE